MLVLTFLRYTLSKVARHNSKKTTFLSLCFVDFPSFWTSFFVAVCPSLWHLWQQKIKIAVGCVCATRTHEKRSSRSACLYPFFLLHSFWGKTKQSLHTLYSAISVLQFRVCLYGKVQFSAIFSLFGAKPLHIHIETHRWCVPHPVLSTFTAKANPIYNPQSVTRSL